MFGPFVEGWVVSLLSKDGRLDIHGRSHWSAFMSRRHYKDWLWIIPQVGQVIGGSEYAGLMPEQTTSPSKTTSCLSHSMRGVQVLCWKALKEIKWSEGWICTGVLFASWSQLVTWHKWAEVGNDRKNTVVIAMKACWMPVGRLLLYRSQFTYSHRHCMLVFCGFRMCT